MLFGSKRAYISKRKSQARHLPPQKPSDKESPPEKPSHDQEEVKQKKKLTMIMEKKEDNDSDSACSISDEELDKFSNDSCEECCEKCCEAELDEPDEPIMCEAEASSECYSQPKMKHKSVPVGAIIGSVGTRHKQEVDTNVLCFDLSILKNKSEIATGDAVFCTKCKAMLNSHSNIEKAPETGDQIWGCEFCGNNNKIILEDEEIPKVDELTYVIESAQQAMDKKGGSQDITIMFCIDISGSMCVTQPVSGKLSLKYDKVNKLKDLMKFSDGSYQYMSDESSNQTYISRMQCVQTAIESQLKELSSGAPKRKVGIVTFNNEVTLIGDGSVPPKTFAGDKLSNYEMLLNDSQNDADVYMTKNVETTQEDLIKRLDQIEENGQTALGPGLIVALGAAMKGTPGSRVIICTDGLANVGLGSVDGLVNEESKLAAEIFYQKVGETAKAAGVTISIVSIVSEECNLGLLSPLTELTGGEIFKVNPLNLSNDFASILSEDVIATHVELRVKLHKGLTFRNEEGSNLTEDGSLLTRQIGNATDEQEVTVEYRMKKSEELQKMEDLDFTKIKQLPFQAQISYSSLDGMKCVRVITKFQEITFEKEEAKKEADYKVISVNAVQKTAQLAKQGDFRKAQANAAQWKRMIKGSDQYANFIGNSKPLYSALSKQQVEDTQERAMLLGMEAPACAFLSSDMKEAPHQPLPLPQPQMFQAFSLQAPIHKPTDIVVSKTSQAARMNFKKLQKKQ